ncbi:hypothetical protein CRBSH125_09580 [Afipia carboxidovorans]|nr:hypothetical protein CRBSH125_09580 [Afipia carboxidovorans]
MGPFDLRIQHRIDDGMVSILRGSCEPVAYTQVEGGEWHVIPADQTIKSPAAVLYSDGEVFDFVLMKFGMSPWRERRVDYRPHIRVPAGRLAA